MSLIDAEALAREAERRRREDLHESVLQMWLHANHPWVERVWDDHERRQRHVEMAHYAEGAVGERPTPHVVIMDHRIAYTGEDNAQLERAIRTAATYGPLNIATISLPPREGRT